MKKSILLLISCLLLVNCVRDYVVSTSGSSLGVSTVQGTTCSTVTNIHTLLRRVLQLQVSHGADQIWNDDFNVHKKEFVGHIIGADNKAPNITNWYNTKTKSSGIIKTTRTWNKRHLKCRDYESTIDISLSWIYDLGIKLGS